MNIYETKEFTDIIFEKNEILLYEKLSDGRYKLTLSPKAFEMLEAFIIEMA